MINIFISFSIIIHYEIHRIFTLLLLPHSTHNFLGFVIFIKALLLNTIGRMEIFILGVFVSLSRAYTIPGFSCFNDKIVSWYLAQHSPFHERDDPRVAFFCMYIEQTHVILNNIIPTAHVTIIVFLHERRSNKFFTRSSSLKSFQTLKIF